MVWSRQALQNIWRLGNSIRFKTEIIWGARTKKVKVTLLKMGRVLDHKIMAAILTLDLFPVFTPNNYRSVP